MTKHDRLILFWDSLKHFTNLAHHIDHEGQNTPFTREEAVMVLGTTTAAISSANAAQKSEELKEAA